MVVVMRWGIGELGIRCILCSFAADGTCVERRIGTCVMQLASCRLGSVFFFSVEHEIFTSCMMGQLYLCTQLWETIVLVKSSILARAIRYHCHHYIIPRVPNAKTHLQTLNHFSIRAAKTILHKSTTSSCKGPYDMYKHFSQGQKKKKRIEYNHLLRLPSTLTVRHSPSFSYVQM